MTTNIADAADVADVIDTGIAPPRRRAAAAPTVAAPLGLTVSADRHLPALDGLRGIAILLVLLVHFAYGAHHMLLGRVFFTMTNFGWAGVDLFFVLSGFLITGILIDSKGGPHYFRNFYARRALRIFPLYYGTLLLVLVALPVVRGLASGEWRWPQHQWWFWTYATNGFALFDPAAYQTKEWSTNLAHFWSLAVEEHFYLIWPVVVLLLSRRQLMVACVALMVVALAARSTYLLMVDVPRQPGGAFSLPVHLFTPFRMDSLAMGALLAAAVRGPGGLAALVAPAWWTLAGTGTLVAGFILARGGNSMPGHFAAQTIGYTLLALMFAALLLIAVAGSSAGRWGGWVEAVSSHAVLRFFGKYSYGIYVFHYLFIYELYAATTQIVSISYTLSVLVRLIVGTAVSVLVALVSWHLFEKHFLRLKSRFNYERRDDRAHSAG